MTYYKFNKQTLTYEKVNLTGLVSKSIGITLGICFLFGFTITSNKKYIPQEEKLIVINEYNKFTNVKFQEKIKEFHFKFGYILYAQALRESNNFTSNIFKENNNFFGMKEAKIRLTLSKSTQNGHAYYNCWQDCITDYALYYSTYLNNIQTEEEYYTYLKSYAQDDNYISKLKTIVDKNKLKEKFYAVNR